MSSGQESKRNKNQDLIDEQLMVDFATTDHVDSDNESESDIRSQWFDQATSGNINEIKRLLQLGANIGWENSEKTTMLHLAAKGGHKEVIDLLIMLGAAIESRDMYSKTALHWSSGHGHKEIVNLLIKSGAAVNARDNDSKTALHQAAGNGYTEVVELPLKHGAAVDATNEKSGKVLHWAASGGHKEVVNLLIEHGIAVDAKDNNSNTALHRAAVNGCTEVVELLIAHGAAVDVTNKRLNTPLHCAAGNGHKYVVELLIAHGAAVDATNKSLNTPLHWAAGNGQKDVVELLIAHGTAVDVTNESLDTPLHWAAGNGHKDVVGSLIAHGAAVDVTSKSLNTPLRWAAGYGHRDVVDLLIAHGAAVNTTDEGLDTPLHLAAEKGHKDVVELLIEHGAAVDATSINFNTSLHRAAEKGHKEVVKLLIRHGAAVDATNKNLNTPLHWAAVRGHKDAIGLLIEHGAAVDATNKYSNTPLYWAAIRGHKEVVNQLIEHGASVDATDVNSETVLHWAAGNGHTEVVDLLIKHGAAVNVANKTLATPLHRAAEGGHKEVVNLLIEHSAAVDAMALYLAAGNGHKDVVDLLIEHGAAIEGSDERNNTALHLAAEDGHTDVVELLIKHGACMEATNVNGQTPLMIAVQADELPMVSLLIEKGSNIEAIDKTFSTSLHWSAKKGQLAILEFLLQKSANIEATTNHGDTALHLAVESNHFIIVATLINHCANIEAENGDGNSPIQLALLKGHVDIVEQLKLAGARIDNIGYIIADMLYQALLAGQVDRIGEILKIYNSERDKMLYMNNTLHRAVREGQTDAVSTILNCGADTESLNEDGLSPLFMAGQYPKVISTLIHHGACIHARNIKDKDQSVLHHYASRGQMEGLTLLLNCGSDVHIIDKDSKTILHYAAEIGDYEIAAILLQRGLDINAKNVRGETALHCATRCGRHETVDLLLQQGVDINAQNNVGENALHIAVENDMIEIAGTLLDNGIDVDATNYTSKSTALHFAIEAKNCKAITLLVERHADTNAIDKNNETALHIAATNNLIEECGLLITHGANIDAKGKYNWTPLFYAVESCNSDLVSLLLNYGASIYERDSYHSLMEHAILTLHNLTGYESERGFVTVIKMLVEAGAESTGIEEMPELQKRFPTLRDVVSKSSNPHPDKKLAVLHVPTKKEHAYRENLNEVDITLAEYRGNSNVVSEGSIGNTRKLSCTKHKYGFGFPSFKRLQLEKYSDNDDKDIESDTSATASSVKLLNSFITISVDDRAVTILRSLLDCVDISFFVSEQFFMLESKRCVGMIPPKWASHFDKMNGIIRQPGLLIVQVPPKVTSCSIPIWYGSTNPYLRFIDAVYVCRRSSSHFSQEVFADVLGGSEQELATNLHAALIAGLSILSIAGGDGLVEKLVMAICEVKMDPIQNMSRHDNTYDDWQIRNRFRCACDPESNHRPLSPIAAAKSVGMSIWRERHSYTVNRVWDLKQDKLVNNIDVKKVVFITHRWRKDEVRYQDLIKSTKYQRQQISKMSKKLYRIHKTLRKRARYVWLDTICIDKSNLSELDEAIRSMYKWYASCAAVVLDFGTSLDEWHSRGWCLQEGAAAGVLYGISKSGNLATIHKLATEQHHNLCTLDLHLFYRPGNAVEILARMDVRKTTREEDMAYAVAGIFSIDLTLAYGEGLRSRTRLLHQLAIQKGDLSFLSFYTTQLTPQNYLPVIDPAYYLVATCARASAPITVSHFGMCFEVQLIKGEQVRQELARLKQWIQMSFAKGRYVGVEDLINVGEQPEYQRSSSVELAIVHDIRSLILVQVYGHDMQTGGGKPIKLCYRLQCCQIEETEFARLFTWSFDEGKMTAAGSEELKRAGESEANVTIEDAPDNDIPSERIWLGDMADSTELSPFDSESVGRRGRRRRR